MDSTSRVAIILYIVAYTALALVLLLSAPQTSVVPRKERRVPVAVVLALPLILVRLVYSACSIFLHDHLFNLVNGSVVVLVVMAVVEEFVVVVIFLTLGFLVERLDNTNQGPIASRGWKNRRAKKQGRVNDVELQQQETGIYAASQGQAPQHT